MLNKEKLNRLWLRVNSVIEFNNLEYGCAVTLGSIFGEMRAEIERLYKINNMEQLVK